jgi:serine/threonine-protein kinase
MADVFLAIVQGPAGFNKLAVIKRLRHMNDESLLTMFLDEARLAARLTHPNIVHTYEVGQEAGRYFIAMEYLEGQALREVQRALSASESGLEESLIAFICANALKGLHHAHELRDFDGTPLGVVHRDISPHNVFVTYGGEVKLIDFGIAKTSLNAVHTETGVLKGKVRYMAPEQVAEGRVDRRADIFAFGIVLWEMLTRRPLFEGDAAIVLSKLVGETIPTVRSVRPEASPELEAIAMRALRREPAERYATAEEMRVDLERCLGQRDTELEQALAKLMGDLFEKKRDEVRARIEDYVAKHSSADGAHAPTAARSEELPLIGGDDSGSGSKPRSSEASDVATITARVGLTASAREHRTGIIVGSLALVLAVAGGLFAARGRRPPATDAPVASAATSASVSPAPAVTTAHVRFESSPPGALVQRDGRPIDRTPAILNLEPGPQTLVLTLDGYEVETVPLDVHPGDMGTRSVVLRKLVPVAQPAASTAAPAPVRGPARANAAVAAPKPTAGKEGASQQPEKVKIRVLDDSQ